MEGFEDLGELSDNLDLLGETSLSDLETSAAELLEEREEVGETSRKRKSRDEDDDDPTGLGVHMCISQRERDWAVALKEATLQGENTKNIPLSDMEFAQHAMVENGNLVNALERIQKMHLFRSTYKIEDTVEHGIQCIKDFMKHHPGFHLNLGQCPRHKHFVHVLDFAKFHPKKVRFDKDWKVFLERASFSRGNQKRSFVAMTFSERSI